MLSSSALWDDVPFAVPGPSRGSLKPRSGVGQVSAAGSDPRGAPARLQRILPVLALLLALLLRLSGAAAEPPGPLDRLADQPGSEWVTLRGTLLEDPRRPPALAPTGPAGPSAPQLMPQAASAGGAALQPGLEPMKLHRPGAAGAAAILPRAAHGPCKVLIQTETARSELAFADCPPLRQSWQVRVSGPLSRLRPAPHPLLAGPAERLAAQGVRTRLRVERLQVLERPATPVLDLRQRIAGQLIAVAGAERGGLLAALVLGSAVVPLPQELREAFRASGLSHALAASGFHLTVLLGVVTALGRPLGRPWRLALAAGAILGFLLLAGPQGSVVRAVLMGAVALLALECGRRARPLPLLLATVVTMLWIQPSWLRDVGFQLSVLATAGLLITASPLEQAIAARLPEGRGGRAGWWRRLLAPAVAVPLAATLWTLPLQLLHFGVVPLYAVPANLVAGPLLTPLTLAAMLLAVVAVLAPALLPLLLLPVDPLARLLLAIADGFAGLPMAQWQTGRPLPWLVALFAIALLALLLPRPRPWLRPVAALLLLVVAVVHLQGLRADQLLLVHQGAAGEGRDLLLARSQGRGALISRRADPFSCRQVRSLKAGFGLSRLDWVLLLDPVAAEDPACWMQQSDLVVAYGDGSVPLAAGERLESPGLAVQALSQDSHALRLELGRQRWLLLPDRQALRAWRQLAETPPRGVWLGFRPRPQERLALQAGVSGAGWRWISGSASPASLPAPWRASGDSGWLQAAGG